MRAHKCTCYACIAFTHAVLPTPHMCCVRSTDARRPHRRKSHIRSTHIHTHTNNHEQALRDGKWKELDSGLLVPGDIVEIKNDWLLPCDFIILGVCARVRVGVGVCEHIDERGRGRRALQSSLDWPGIQGRPVQIAIG